MVLDIDYLRTWIGRSEAITDRIDAGHLARLLATLDYDETNPRECQLVPSAGHWIYCNPLAKTSDIGLDGHPKRGGFLPPVNLPRRMWAGGRIVWLQPLWVDDTVTRISTVTDVSLKSGKSGDLVFVLVKHQYSTDRGICIEEEQDIVYREDHNSKDPPINAQPAPLNPEWTRNINPDPVMLFRYSALTFNGHRIHYDLPYVVEEEGYPGLIVHGPLIATLLMDLCNREHPDRLLKWFNYKAISPVFHTQSFTVNGIPKNNGKGANLWAANFDGGIAMQAEAEFSD